jgi:hypothetical protein
MNSKILICGTEYGLWHRSCSYSGEPQKLLNFGGDLIAATERTGA